MAFTLGDKSVTVSGVAVSLSATSKRIKQIIIQAKASNTGPVFVGDSTVNYSGASGGIQLNTPVSGAVDTPLVLGPNALESIGDLKDIYVNCQTGLQGVNFLFEEF